jgi:hypothetical protein
MCCSPRRSFGFLSDEHRKLEHILKLAYNNSSMNCRIMFDCITCARKICRAREKIARRNLATTAWSMLAVVCLGFVGCGERGPVAVGPASLDGIWESASSSVVIENTCGAIRAPGIFDSSTFPIIVARRGTAVDLTSGGTISATGRLVGARGFSVDLPYETMFFSQGVFSFLRQRIMFSEANGSEAQYVLVFRLTNRSDGSPDCQLKLGGVAMKVQPR